MLVLIALQTVLAICFAPQYNFGQILSSPAINIAQGKKIEATSTCGLNVSEEELYCKLATVPGKLAIHGLSCEHCGPSSPSENHPIEYAIDGSERWWQSPPLSRGLQYQQVNITIDLGQEYQVAYVIIKTGNAPRPGTWALEKSVDGGKTFTPWQYFATTNSECLNYFGISSLLQSFKDDTTVTCTTSYSQVPPFENGEIHISLVNGRPGAANFSYNQALQEWTRATHIRLRLLKVKTLLADLLPLARQDPTVTRRYFYSIKDISVGGICMCNGHADDCVQSSLNESSQFVCRCNHQTCGIKCERCCPGFVQKPWRPATPDSSNECEPCNCHNHATDCYYNEAIAQEKRSLDINGNYEGGGVCVNCLHNTYGINCERCKPGYYRPTGVPKTSRDVCQACTCSGRFSTGRCFDGDGQCECLENFSGPRCNQCNDGFYGFPNCKPCDCHPLGTSGRVCGPSGDQCPCNPGYTGAKCDQCDSGYYGFPNCRKCNCDNVGALTPNVCDVNTGQCTCRQMYTSRQCNQCSRGFYSFPECKVCNCDAEGTARDICDPNTGVCICMNNFAGPRCEVCNEGYFRFPACDDCSCSSQGSVSPNCSQFGVCECQENYDGFKCERCKVGYYNYPRCVKCACDPLGSQHQFCDPSTGQCTCKGSFRGVNCDLCRSGYYGFPDCQACQCNPAGIKPLPDRPLGDCSLSNEGQCDCKDHVQGLACTECKGGYYNLQSSNSLGCDNCDCNLDGVIGGIRSCDKVTGQCTCKLYVTGRRCTSCKPGFYGLAGRKVFGCTGCGCDVGGAFDQLCDTLSGQCKCRANVTGRDCSRPIPLHYYPTLLHIKAELEDGTTAPTKQGSDVLSPDEPFSSDGSPARFGFDESVFPGYSWRGYATMSDLQRALKVTMDIPKTARYHIVFHYMLNGSSPVTGEVMFMPKGGVGSKQSSKVTFPVTQAGPAHQTVGETDMATQFMLTKGKWDLMLLLPPASILLDYVVALPQEYYEAYQLEEKVTKPCQVNGFDSLCNQFSYLSTKKPGLFTSEMETGYIIRNGRRQDTQLFKNESVQEQLDFTAMALLDRSQNRVTADFSIPKRGKYVLVIQYYKPSDGRAPLTVYLRYPRGTQRGDFNLQSCNYRFGCRQVAVDPSGAVKVFDVKQLQRMVVTLLSRSSAPVAVDSITAIPLDMWTLDFIAPNILCTTTGGVCIPTSYPIPKGAVDIEAGDDDPSEQQPPKQDPSTKLQYLQGPKKHTLSGSVPRPGKYAVIVQYYHPMHSSFDADVSVTSDRAVDGNVKFHYCPHTSGCRSVVRDSSAASSFNIGRTFVDLEFDIPVNSSTWIDYVLLVPEDAFSGELQEDSPVPRTQEFLDSCSKHHFFIKPSNPQFCKDSVFSLTTSFNNGSFACDCNPRGSLNNDCQEFGGQCSCRPNVIGRTCSRCRTGYYGFPNCRKCSCVFCNEITGACDCPPNTVGPNCGSCLQGTYGHDPILGCQNCECERNGVIGGNIACDSKTGQCNCKPSHTGRQCNKCATGYYNYPLCQKCDLCDPRGVDERVCDGDNGQCFCKPGVNGERCDKCLAGHFNLDATNPNGCTKCWCTGLSDTCFEGVKFWSKVNTMDGWTIENTPASVTKIGADELYAGISSQRNEKDKAVYWVAPKEYLGKKISSYGGKLTYTVEYMVPQGGGSPVLTKKPDVVMEGKNGKVLHYRNQLELSPGQSTSVEAQFLEYLWEDESRSNITRDDFMSVLLNIKSLKLRATYSTEVAETTLSGVVMNVAVDGPVDGAARAKSVELCECPERATGASCELCGKGYTRGADNSSCIPCNCFRHSDDCNDETGECFSCLHNTTGPNCEVCEPGFYGDATVGSIDDCRTCECPLGMTSNSFATSCALNSFNDLVCTCEEGYAGQRCERCADGFFGNPTQLGDFCTRCTCSGNIDHSVNGSCDSITGQCLKCTNGATGDQCDRCLPGYYGDAVVAKNCARCACSECGTVTAVCNHTIGACKCKHNVIGDGCDSCKLNTWNFDSCLGCEDCDCSAVSLSPSCDVKTGQCECPDGITGRKCDRCKAGYFNYSDAGCQPCNCGGRQGAENLYGFCDINTGQCCKWGGNCTICPENYILTSEGCEYCGECVGRLLATATKLDNDLTLALKSLKQGTAGIIAEQRFTDVNETLQRLIPPTNKYNETMETVSQLVGVSSQNAFPQPLAIYPLNAKYGGKDIGPNSNPEALLISTVTVSGPYGKRDGAVRLKGEPDSYIEIPNKGLLDTRKSMSILVWVYPEEQAGPIVYYDTFIDSSNIGLWYTTPSRYQVQFKSINKNTPPSESLESARLGSNIWHHVAATYDYDNGKAKLWVDEELQEEADLGVQQQATNSSSVTMGSLPNVPYYFKGRFACLQFFDKVLNQDQLAAAKRACDLETESSRNASQGGLIQRTESSEKTTEEVDSKVEEITDKATKALANATFTKDDALALEQEIRDALNRTQDIVDLAKKIANTLKTDKANQTLLLERAEDILKELMKQDFSSINATIIEEEELAMTLLNQARTLLNDTVSLWSDLSEANKALDGLLGTFGTIKQKTSGILENASLAMDTNNISKRYDSETPLKDAMKRKEEVEISLVSLQEVINSTNFKLASAGGSLQAFNGSFPRLDDLIDRVNKRMANLSKTLNELTSSVLMAQNHSEELRKRADELDKLLTDIEFARKAVNASQRYSDIANALNESLAIAREAEEIAMDALDQAQNLSSQTRDSKARSSSLNKTASNTEDKVDSELASLLDDIKERLELIRAKIRKVSGDLTDVQSNFPGFDELASRIGGRASDLENNATESKNIADDARQKAEEIEAQLSGLSGLKKSIIMTNGNITNVEKQVREALNKSSIIKEKVVVQDVRHEQINEELDTEVKRRLDDIEGMLVRANTLLRYTSVVMKFDGETVSEPVLPPAIQKETRALDILLYAKPEKPDGLLLFVGDASNSDSNRQKRQSQQCGPDFAAVELKAAKPVLKMCTAQRYREFEASETISTDGQRWYKVEAGMDGDQAKLFMKYRGTSNEDVTAVSIRRSLRMNNPRMVLNENSKLIVGGVSMAMQLPDEISRSNFTGCVDGFQINYHFVGTWDSELIKPDKDGYCPTRSGVKEFTVPESEELQPDRTFFGTGYLKSGPYYLDPLRTLDFTFRTSSSNGILVIAVDGDKFQAVELSRGYVLFSYNLGLGYRKIRSKKNYDTGKWVSVKKTNTDRRGFRYSLKITKSDGTEEELAKDSAYYPGKGINFANLVNAEFVYWGGIENRTTIPKNVTSKFFKGCLKDMSLSRGEIEVLTSPGYIRGCHLKPAWNVTFLSDRSYLEKVPFLNRRTRGFTIGLSFQVPPATLHGLLFVEAHGTERDFIVLGLVEGKVVFKANPGSLPVTLQSVNKYNDGKWHFVTVHKDGLNVRLYVDMEEKAGVFPDKRQQYIQTTQNMYLGGIPTDYTVMTKDFDSVILESLKGGSIRHLTFDEKLFNFMDYLKRHSVIFDGDDYSEPTPKDLIIEKPVTTATTPTATKTTSFPVDPLVSRSTAEVPGTSQLPTGSPSTTEVSDTPKPTPTTEPVITTTKAVQTTPTTAAPRCPMPQKPAQLTGVMGFGLDLNSHANYNITGPLLKLRGKTTDLSFEFRASNPNGILLYTANAKQADFLECHVEDSKVSCSFSAGGGILKLTSDEASYSGGNWHTVKLSRNRTTGTLYIDGREKESGKAGGDPTSIDGLKKLFLGGVPEGFDNRRVPAGSRVSLPGCIRSVTVDGKGIGPPTTSHKVQECYQGSPESGVSFEHGGGSLKVGEQYSVGLSQEILLEIKPTSYTGLLLSSSSSTDYIVLEMDRGNVIFRAENGGGQLVVEYSLEDPLALCDGNWHKIRALKVGNLVRLKVDDGPEREGGGKGSQTTANIYDPLYAGGLPEGVVGKGVTVNESYTGCMRNLVSRSPGSSPQRLSLTNPVMMTGNVFLGGCPYM